MNIFERVDMVERNKDDWIPSSTVVSEKQNPNTKKKEIAKALFLFTKFLHISVAYSLNKKMVGPSRVARIRLI